MIEESAAAAPGAGAPALMAAKESAKPESSGGKLSPAAKRVAEENRVDPKTVAGSGRDGRVSKSDVVNYLSAKEGAPAPPAAAARTGARALKAPPPRPRRRNSCPPPARAATEPSSACR